MTITLDTTPFPTGWTRYSGEARFNNTRVENPAGYVVINQNWPYALWSYEVDFLRSEYESQNDLRMDDLHNFFLNRAGARAFLFDDVFDDTHSDRRATAKVELIGGVYRLTKRYPDTVGGGYYTRLITRPRVGTIGLQGGAASGVLDYATGIVTGISSVGTWTGSFDVPCIFLDDGLKYEVGADGAVRGLTVKLREIRV